LGWHYGATDTLAEVTTVFNEIEKEGYTVCDVDIEKYYGGSWEFIYKIVEK